MTNLEGLTERYGHLDDIVVTRFYFDTRGGRQHVDFDGKLWAIEAVGVKRHAKLSPQQLLDGVEDSDPEALRALVWVLLKHRDGQDRLSIDEVDFDVTSVRRYNLDGEGVRVLVRDPDIDWPTVERVAKTLTAELPTLPAEESEAFAVAAVVAARVSPGEDPAGGEPADAPDGHSPTTSSGSSPNDSPR